MKTAGLICLMFGLLGFIGAASKGNSAFGPFFFIALGLFLLYRVNNKEEKNKKTTIITPQTQRESLITSESIMRSTPESKIGVKIQSDKQLENLEDIQSQLTAQQREAAICLISFLGGFNDNLADEAPIMIFKQSALFFGVPDSPMAISKIMSKYPDADTLIDIVLTIKSTKAKEFLLLTCYDLIKSSYNSEASEILFNIANDMGYDKTKMRNLINSYQ